MAAARDYKKKGDKRGTHLESHINEEKKIVIINYYNNINLATLALPSPLTYTVI